MGFWTVFIIIVTTEAIYVVVSSLQWTYIVPLIPHEVVVLPWY